MASLICIMMLTALLFVSAVVRRFVAAATPSIASAQVDAGGCFAVQPKAALGAGDDWPATVRRRMRWGESGRFRLRH